MTDLDDIAAAEAWFRRRGLPWFVDSVDARVSALLRRRWIWFLLVSAAAAALSAVALAHTITENWPSSLLIGLLVAGVVLLAYAGGPLRAAVIARWAARRALTELDLMLPLVSRALPLLLLFMTFLFVNTEVWQVASALHATQLIVVAALFSTLGIAFLLTRLPEEVREVQQNAAGEGVAQACRGTPLEQRAIDIARDRADSPDPSSDPLTRTQQANLLLVLLVMQTFQVFLLASAIFVFFVVFGLLSIRPAVIESWIGHPPSPVVPNLGLFSVDFPVSWELLRVSVFLSTFAGLYFTVYAVTDANYRHQFFGDQSRGLEQAVGVREVYRTLKRRSSRHR